MSERTKIAIVVEGGLVQAVFSNRPHVEATVLDFDLEGLDTAEVKEFFETNADALVNLGKYRLGYENPLTGDYYDVSSVAYPYTAEL